MGFFSFFPLLVSKDSSLLTKAKEQNILWVDVPPFGFPSQSCVPSGPNIEYLTALATAESQLSPLRNTNPKEKSLSKGKSDQNCVVYRFLRRVVCVMISERGRAPIEELARSVVRCWW